MGTPQNFIISTNGKLLKPHSWVWQLIRNPIWAALPCTISLLQIQANITKYWDFSRPHYQITVTCFFWQCQCTCRRVIYRLLSQEKECSLVLHCILLTGNWTNAEWMDDLNAGSVGHSARTGLQMPFMSYVKAKPWDIVVLDTTPRIYRPLCPAHPFTSHLVALQMF